MEYFDCRSNKKLNYTSKYIYINNSIYDYFIKIVKFNNIRITIINMYNIDKSIKLRELKKSDYMFYRFFYGDYKDKLKICKKSKKYEEIFNKFIKVIPEGVKINDKTKNKIYVFN
jgi:hypothetical protein